MPNLTMTIEEDILRKARRLAAGKNTSVNAMVRGYLKRMAAKEDQSISESMSELKKCFNTPGLVIGERTWRREDLYDR